MDQQAAIVLPVCMWPVFSCSGDDGCVSLHCCCFASFSLRLLAADTLHVWSMSVVVVRFDPEKGAGEGL